MTCSTMHQQSHWQAFCDGAKISFRHQVQHIWCAGWRVTACICWVQDPNQKVALFESGDIIDYLEKTYAA